MSQPPSPAEHFAKRFFPSIPHMSDAGIRLGARTPASSTLILPARPDWLGDPGRGLLHPGPLTVLADSACGAAVGQALERVQPYATLDLRIDLLRPAGPDREISCTAECFRLTTSVAFTRATLWQAGDDAAIATAQATFMLGTRAKGSRPKPAADAAGSVSQATSPVSTPASADAASAPADAKPVWPAPQHTEPVRLDRPLPYLEYLGMRRARDQGGARVFMLPFAQKLIGNPLLPALHGGVIAGFAQSAAMLHLIEALPEPKLPKAIDFSIDYLRSGRPQDTWARCDIVRVGSRIALVQIWCWQESPEQPIALTRGHFLLADPQVA